MLLNSIKFVTALNSWLLKSDQESADFLSKNKRYIPTIFSSYSKTLYRGLELSEDKVLELTAGRLILDRHTSWSKSKNVVIGFIKDERSKTSTQKGRKVLLEKKITSQEQILDIDVFVNFTGFDTLLELGFDETNLDSVFKEQKVLISKNLIIKKTEFSFI